MTQILVVDDSATMRRMVMTALRGVDASFDQASSGLEAIERLSIGRVDLMILDLNMPDVHGLEVLRFARGHEAFEKLPVLVLTTRGDDESQDAAAREGASGYLTKPFVPETLVAEVSRLLAAR